MTAYYNEFDPFAASWLEHLIEEGVIADGVVDRRSIDAVEPGDLAGFAQCHFFAGIGVWSYALRQAGWHDGREIWTGSCPCQPFSAAGKGQGFNDARHKWPAWFRLIAECRPRVIIGEQVDTAGAWIDLVQTDMENLSYAFAAVDLPAAGFAGAHRRQRLSWVANADVAKWGTDGPRGHVGAGSATGWLQGDGHARKCVGVGQAANADGGVAGNRHLQRSGQYRQLATDSRTFSRLAVAYGWNEPEIRTGNGAIRQQRSPFWRGPVVAAWFGTASRNGDDQRCCGVVHDAAGSRRIGQRIGGTAGALRITPWLQEPGGRSAFGLDRRVGDPTRRGRGEFRGSLVAGRGGHTDSASLYHSWARPVGEPIQPRLPDAQYGIVRRQGRWPEGGAASEPSGSPRPGLDWLLCRDSKWRPVEPGTCPLVDAYPNRMGLLRGIGNALDAEAQANFIAAYMEVRAELYE